MLSDSKIMTKTSVGMVVKVAIMRYNLCKKTSSCIYVWGAANVRMTLSSRDGKRIAMGVNDAEATEIT